MQTFLPYPDYWQSARCLDDKRLGKQRVEAYQLLRALEFGPYQYHDGEEWVSCDAEAFRVRLGSGRYRRTPWYNHPATKMWFGYESALAMYGLWTCNTWIARGFRDSLRSWFYSRGSDAVNYPNFIFDSAFHRSHQSNLVRKDPAHYRQFFPDVPDNLPYVWPTKTNPPPR